MILFKVLNTDGTPYHGGSGQWNLPTEDGPGEWMPPIEGGLIPCRNGYHLCRESDLAWWLGPAIFEAEARGERVECNDKIVVRDARLLRRVEAWNERTARLFAADCAERVLHIYEAAYPGDHRPRQAIAVARAFVNDQMSRSDLAAAEAAAWDAAGAAAWTVARAAARAVARAAARDAAWDAARAVARAARAVAMDAWDAARAVAWATAWTARATARAARAARAVARAARAVAMDAERRWQTERLMTYIGAMK